MLIAAIVAFFFVGSMAFYWANLPGGDWLLVVQSAIDPFGRQDLLHYPFSPFLFLLSSLVFSIILTSVEVLLSFALGVRDRPEGGGTKQLTLERALVLGLAMLVSFLIILPAVTLVVTQYIQGDLCLFFAVFISAGLVLGLVLATDFYLSDLSFDRLSYQRRVQFTSSQIAVFTSGFVFIWVLLKFPPSPPPIEVQIGQLERTVAAYSNLATQAYVATATSASLHSTLEMLQSTMGVQPNSEPAISQFAATARVMSQTQSAAVATNSLATVQILQATLAVSPAETTVPPQRGEFWTPDRVIAVIGIVVAMSVGVVQIWQAERKK